jgi:hypothetical protein
MMRASQSGANVCPASQAAGPQVLLEPMNLIQGQDATCPHCWESINLTLDLSVPGQSYIEDCPVCCKPMVVSYTTADGELSVEPGE